MSYVGANYDMRANGREWRIMIVGMERSEGPDLFDRELRSRDHDRALAPDLKNKHMLGTKFALRLAYGREPGIDRFGDQLLFDNGSFAHIFECYALVNLRLCSAVKKNQKTGQLTKEALPAPKMYQQCARHLKATVDILQPNLVLLQTTNPVAIESLEASMIERSVLREGRNEAGHLLSKLTLATIGRTQTLVAVLNHPSHRSRSWWRINDPYSAGSVRPTIDAALDFAGITSGTSQQSAAE